VSKNVAILLAIAAAIAAAVLLSNFLVDFHDWNRMQGCASTGGRNCGPTHR